MILPQVLEQIDKWIVPVNDYSKQTDDCENRSRTLTLESCSFAGLE